MAAEVHAQARRGIQLLMARQVLLQVFNFAGGVVLARTLDPAHFGLLAIAAFLVELFTLVGDFGVSASFIQRRDELMTRDLQAAFTLQQLALTMIVATLWLAAPWLAALYPKAPPELAWVTRALAVGLFFTSWRAISALQLERQLRYDWLARIEVAEAIAYQLLAVTLALAGYGVWSLVWAALGRGLLGAVLVYAATPWPVRLVLDRQLVRQIAGAGLPFQLQAIVNQASNWVTPTVVASAIGPRAVGFLAWSSANGRKPLLLVESVMRVAYPHFARIQHDRAEVERILTRYLTFLLVPTTLWCAELLVAGPLLVRWIYTDKWGPAVPTLVLYALTCCLDVVAWVTGVTLNSLGEVHHTTRVVVLRSVATVVVSVPLVLLIDYNGVPLGYLLSSALILPWLLRGLGPGAGRRVLAPLAWVSLPLLAGILVGMPARWAPLPLMWQALLTALVVAAAYIGACAWASPAWLRDWARGQLAGRSRAGGTGMDREAGA